MQINFENFPTAKFDIFSLFNDRWALVTAGTGDNFNTMTIGWGTMGSIWGGAGRSKQIVEVFVRDNRRTFDFLQDSAYFTVCFFPEEYKKDLMTLGSKSGHEVPDKVALTKLTPRALENTVGFEEADLTFVCKKIYSQKLDIAAIPEAVVARMYGEGNPIHYAFFGEIVDAFGTIYNFMGKT